MHRRALVLLLALSASACTTVPPPSEFAGARWYDGQAFVPARAWVRNGRFVEEPRRISETIPLDGLLARTPDGRPAPQPGEAADFDLYRADPATGARPVARVRGGKLVAPPEAR